MTETSTTITFSFDEDNYLMIEADTEKNEQSEAIIGKPFYFRVLSDIPYKIKTSTGNYKLIATNVTWKIVREELTFADTDKASLRYVPSGVINLNTDEYTPIYWLDQETQPSLYDKPNFAGTRTRPYRAYDTVGANMPYPPISLMTSGWRWLGTPINGFSFQITKRDVKLNQIATGILELSYLIKGDSYQFIAENQMPVVIVAKENYDDIKETEMNSSSSQTYFLFDKSYNEILINLKAPNIKENEYVRYKDNIYRCLKTTQKKYYDDAFVQTKEYYTGVMDIERWEYITTAKKQRELMTASTVIRVYSKESDLLATLFNPCDSITIDTPNEATKGQAFTIKFYGLEPDEFELSGVHNEVETNAFETFTDEIEVENGIGTLSHPLWEKISSLPANISITTGQNSNKIYVSEWLDNPKTQYMNLSITYMSKVWIYTAVLDIIFLQSSVYAKVGFSSCGKSAYQSLYKTIKIPITFTVQAITPPVVSGTKSVSVQYYDAKTKNVVPDVSVYLNNTYIGDTGSDGKLEIQADIGTTSDIYATKTGYMITSADDDAGNKEIQTDADTIPETFKLNIYPHEEWAMIGAECFLIEDEFHTTPSGMRAYIHVEIEEGVMSWIALPCEGCCAEGVTIFIDYYGKFYRWATVEDGAPANQICTDDCGLEEFAPLPWYNPFA